MSSGFACESVFAKKWNESADNVRKAKSWNVLALYEMEKKNLFFAKNNTNCNCFFFIFFSSSFVRFFLSSMAHDYHESVLIAWSSAQLRKKENETNARLNTACEQRKQRLTRRIVCLCVYMFSLFCKTSVSDFSIFFVNFAGRVMWHGICFHIQRTEFDECIPIFDDWWFVAFFIIIKWEK